MPIHTMRLGSERALIISNSIPNLPLENLCKPSGNQIDLGVFGLFESASPNFATYYPEVSESDLKPKDEDFIYPLFRALSEITVNKSFNPVDFSKNNVLKKSMKMLIGQTIYPNHEMIVGNELGAVKNVEWQEAYETDKGIKIPAGINAQLMVDGKKAPNIARSIQMDPPAIHSVSVTVTFEWEKSHNIADDEFYRKMGTFDEAGNMYTRVATRILRYSEISFVPHGADPYAKKVGEDGKIIKPEEAARRDGTLKNSEIPGLANFSFGDEGLSLSEQDNTIPTVIITNTKSLTNTLDMKREHLLLMAFTLGFMETDTLSDEDLTKKVTTGLTALKAAKDKAELELAQEVAKHSGEAILTEDQKTKISLADKYLTDLRAKTTAAYKLTAADKVDEKVIGSIADANETVLLGLLTQYEEQFNNSQPLTCKECKSTSISRQSAESQGGEGADGKGNPKTVSAEEAIEVASKMANKEITKTISAFEEVKK